jgi:hypothetical protein
MATTLTDALHGGSQHIEVQEALSHLGTDRTELGTKTKL